MLALLLVSGCALPDENAPVLAYPYTRLAPMSPPDTPYEERQYPENPTLAIWRPGHWEFDGRDFNWTPGQLIARPSPDAVWSPDRWERRGFGYAYVHGYWR